MTTPVELINLALKQSGVIGVGQTASAEDMQDCFKLMQMMLAQWQTKRYMMYHLVNLSIPCTGALSYSIGPGGDIAQASRPNEIVTAFIRLPAVGSTNRIDYSLNIIRAREDYDRILAKTMGSMPSFLFYDSGFPMGTLYAWPVPSNVYELHVTVLDQFQTFATVADVINLPAQYEEAIMYNLAGRMRPMYGMQPDPTITGLAKASLNCLQSANVQIPRMQVNPFLTSKGRYNIYTDQGN
jgi:hypothetical protein